MEHDHHHSEASERRVGLAALITGVFMLVEVAGGVMAGSLALIADAGHMLTDFASLALAWWAFRIARRPADWRRTYGFGRMQVLAAFVNGLALLAIALWIVIEAMVRVASPVEVMSGPMLVVACAGLAANLAAFWVLHGADSGDLNVRGAMLHIVGDMLGSCAAIAAALVILWTGWMAADPLLSIVVALLIVRGGVSLVREAGHILLEGAPAGLDVKDIESDLETHIAAVEDVHHVHAWSMNRGHVMATLHARVSDQAVPETVSLAIRRRLHDQFGVTHATIEIEHASCAGEECRTAPHLH